MSLSWRIRVGVGLGVTAVVLAGCGGGSSESGSDSEQSVLRIGFITPLTGPSSTTGIDARDGAMLAAELANAAGTLPDTKIEIVVEDDKGTPESGVIAYQKLRDQGIDIITGTMNSSVAVALGNQVNADPDVLYFISGAQSQIPLDEQPGDMVFGLTHTNDMYADANLNWIKDVSAPKTVAFLGENSDFGVAEQKQLEAHWADGGPEIVLTETFDRTLTDYSSILAKVRESGAEGLYVAAASATIPASIFTQADELGLDVKKYMNAGLMSPDLIKAGGEAVEGITSADIYHPSLDNPENKEFVAAFEDSYDRQPTSLNSLGYDSINLLVGAIAKSGDAEDTEAVAQTLKGDTWNTSRGELTWDETGRALTDTLIIGIENGELVVVDVVAD